MDWKTENDKLVKEFVFSNFIKAVEFVNRIVPLAEKSRSSSRYNYSFVQKGKD